MKVLALEILRLRKYYEKYIKSTLVYLLIAVGVSIITTIISLNSYFNWVLGFGVSNTQLFQFSAIFGFSSLLYNLLFLSQVYLKKENKARLREEKILTESIEKELHQFKNEVNPKLLYDCLESLITLIHKNTEESEDYIDRLSMVYRYILSNRQSEFVNLSEDIKAAESIVYLLNPKFSNAIILVNDLPKELEQKLAIPGTLPSILESIIRNTIVNQDSKLTITLSHEDEKSLVIEHKINSILVGTEDQTIANIQASYAIYSEQPVVQVKAYNQCFTKIPLLEVLDESEILEQTAHS